MRLQMRLGFKSLVCSAGAAVFLAVGSLQAATVVHEFYLPMPEAQIRTAFTAIRPAATTNMVAVFSIVATAPGTIVTYDQWEDGYELNINSPVQSTTKVWGDGNDANGITPGFTHDPYGLPAGTVIALQNDVTLPRNPSSILYDARDRVGSTKAITVSRACWARNVGTVQASSAEILGTIDHDTAYITPVGEDVLFNNMFQYVGLMIMADQDGTVITIDTDGQGTNAPVTIALNRGESYQVNGGVKKGATINGSAPFQAHMITGNKTVSYESRTFVLRPASSWSSAYLTAVGTAPNGNQAYAFLFNTNNAPVTVNYTTRAGSGTITIPGTNGVLQWQLPQNSGTLFQAPGGQKFFAICAAGAQPGNSAAYDWGFAMLPFEGLSSEAVVGWGPGSNDGTQNGSPVWVTALSPATIYVDYNGDRLGPNTDPNGGRYDVVYTNVALESRRIFDPDKDQTGMRLYTLDGTLLSAMWGEDPSVASPGNPYLDMGSIVVPFPVPLFRKTNRIVTDTGPVGYSTNDIVEYKLTIENKGLLPLGNTVVQDELPPSLSYVTNSTTWNATPIPDHTDATPFPLGPPQGFTVPVILRGGTSIFTYQCRIVNTGAIINASYAGTIGSSNIIIVAGPGGATNTPSSLQFTSTANGPATNAYTTNATIYVRLTDADQNSLTGTVESVTVTVRNDTTGDYETLTLWETGANTGIFTGAVPASASSGSSPENGTLYAPAGSSLTAQYTDPDFPSDTSSASATISAPPPSTFTKVLYLSDPTQALDRIDPVATGDNSTTQTVVLSSGGSGSVTTDAVSRAATAATATSLAFTHTTGAGANRLLMLGTAIGGGTVTNVTYGTQALTRVAFDQDSNPRVRTEVWYLLNPSAGSNTITVRVSAANYITAGAVTFNNVNQTTPLGTASTNNSAAATTIAATTTVASASGELVFACLGVDGDGTAKSITNGTGQTGLWATNAANQTHCIASTKAGASLVTNTWTWNAVEQWAAVGVPIKPSAGGGAGSSITFTQAPSFSLSFSMPLGGVVRITNYVNVASGTMPSNPAVTAALSYGSNTFLTLSNPVYSVSGGSSNLVWSGALPSNVTIPTNQAITFTISSSQPGVTFSVLYDSTSRPSKILLPTTNVISVASLGVYSGSYPDTNAVISASSGEILYVRTTVTDPFGSYDINRLGLSIAGPGGTSAVVLSNASVVASNAASKTYEYTWYSPAAPGDYSIEATAYEGTEGITATRSTAFQLIFTDFGTPSTTEFTTGSNGLATTTFQTNQTVWVRVTDPDQNTNTGLVDSVIVTVTNLISGDSENLTLTESGPNTGVFIGSVAATVSGSPGPNGTLIAPAGSILVVNYIDPNDSADTSSATASVPAAPGVPGLTVVKTIESPASGQLLLGETAEFRILVVNSGSTTQSTISVVDTFPAAAFSYQSAVPAPSSNSVGRLTWNNVGPLNPGQQAVLSVFLTATNGLDPAVNTAVATGTGVTSTGTVTFASLRPLIAVTKTLISPPGPAGVGSNVVYRIVVKNNGNTAIASLPLQDTFSGAFYTFVSATIPPDGTGFGSLLWNDLTGAGTLAPGAAITNDVTLRVTGGGNPAKNTATAEFVTDVYGNELPLSSSTTGLVTLAVSVAGTVYNDANTNGVFNAGETGLTDVTVSLYTDPNGDGNPADGVLAGLQATLADGSYSFLNQPTGRYVVVETDLPGYASSGDSAGTNDNRIAFNAATLTAYTNNNFFDYLPSPTSYTNISGTVWNDLDTNGVYSSGDIGLSGATLELVQDVNGNGVFDSGEPVIQNLTTASNGVYNFSGIVSGNYVVRETDPFGSVSTSTNQIAVTISGGAVPPVDFFDRMLRIGFTLSKTQISPLGLSAGEGEPVVWTVSIVNTGEVALVTVPLTDTYLTNYLSYVSAVPPATTTTNGSLAWTNVGPLAAGTGTNVIVTMTAAGKTSGVSATNTVISAPTTPDGLPPPGVFTNSVLYGIDPAPFLNVTSIDVIVTYDTIALPVYGTNNSQIVGTMWWTNSLTGGSGTLSASTNWTIASVNLNVGTNLITVYGSNSTGTVVSDFVNYIRGPAGTGVPVVDVTNAATNVTYDVSSLPVSGTNNANVIGVMWWTNSLTGGSGTLSASTNWTIASVGLNVGTNLITVYGSNSTGTVTNDFVNYIRGPAGTGVPVVDNTNTVISVAYPVTGIPVSGTNNYNVVGTMWWTNALTGGSGTFPATNNWTIPFVSLNVGANVITISGTNSFGAGDSDVQTVTRAGATTTNYWLYLTATNGMITNAAFGSVTNGSFSLPAGNHYNLWPVPNFGYAFDHWITNGTITNTPAPLNVVMDRDQYVEAVFTPVFVDVTSQVDLKADWVFDPRKGYFIGTLTLSNKASSAKALMTPVWYEVQSNAFHWLRLRFPDGVDTNTSLPYVDLSTQINQKLPSIGNFNLFLDPGESVICTNIALMGRRDVTGQVVAVWADPPGGTDSDNPVILDEDLDGIPNTWESRYPQILSQNNPADAVADADNDGMSNLEEYIAGTDLADENSVFTVTLDGGRRKLDWTWASNRIYTVWYKTNLVDQFKPLAEIKGEEPWKGFTDDPRDKAFYRIEVRMKGASE